MFQSLKRKILRQTIWDHKVGRDLFGIAAGHQAVAAGCSEPQKAGRSGLPNSLQRIASSSCTQRVPAGLPCGMPGIGELIDGAMQQAPQWLRQEMEGIDITLAV